MSHYSTQRFTAWVPGARDVPIEEAGSATDVADRVRQGKAFLKIVSTPWGVEFYVCEAGVEA